jgi:hypothetical protein
VARLWLLVLVGCYDPALRKVGQDATAGVDGTAADGAGSDGAAADGVAGDASAPDARTVDADCAPALGPYDSDFSVADMLPSGTDDYSAGPGAYVEVSGGVLRVGGAAAERDRMVADHPIVAREDHEAGIPAGRVVVRLVFGPPIRHLDAERR